MSTAEPPTAPEAPAAARDPHIIVGSPYELFILALSILSLVNLAFVVLPVDETTKGVVLSVDTGLCLVFIPDFLYRLKPQPGRRPLPPGRVADLLGSLPFPGTRIFRLHRVNQAIRALRNRGGRGVVHEVIANRAETASCSPSSSAS